MAVLTNIRQDFMKGFIFMEISGARFKKSGLNKNRADPEKKNLLTYKYEDQCSIVMTTITKIGLVFYEGFVLMKTSRARFQKSGLDEKKNGLSRRWFFIRGCTA